MLYMHVAIFKVVSVITLVFSLSRTLSHSKHVTLLSSKTGLVSEGFCITNKRLRNS
jgi:hypothetical protein